MRYNLQVREGFHYGEMVSTHGITRQTLGWQSEKITNKNGNVHWKCKVNVPGLHGYATYTMSEYPFRCIVSSPPTATTNISTHWNIIIFPNNGIGCNSKLGVIVVVRSRKIAVETCSVCKTKDSKQWHSLCDHNIIIHTRTSARLRMATLNTPF